MTTPTEELARDSGLLACIDDCYLERGDYKEQLQAFREAVEAESDAERMKQDQDGQVLSVKKDSVFVGEHSVYLNRSCKQRTPVYLQPFPSTEQLQQRVKELEDAEWLYSVADLTLMSSDRDTVMQMLRKAIQDRLANTQGDSK